MRNDTAKGGEGTLVKELCESVVEIQRRSDRMMTMCLVFGEDMIWVISIYAPQSGKPDLQKDKFYDKWDIKSTKKLTFGIGDFNSDVGKKVDGFEGVQGENGIGE